MWVTYQDQGFSVVLLESSLTKHGPFSDRRPSRDEPPGPPFNQIVKGALWGSFRASKNQKKLDKENQNYI